MNPKDYYQSVVLPNINEFKAAYGDARLAFNAIAAVDALSANLYFWCQQNQPAEVNGINDDSHYRAVLAQRNADFSLIRDVAKAQKHFVLSRRSSVSSAQQVEQQSLGWDTARWDEGRWDGPPQIVVTTDAGEPRVIETILDGAVLFLDTEMKRLGAL